MPEKTPTNNDGMALPILLVSVLGIVVLVCVIAFFQWHIKQKDEEFKIILHNKDNEAAYKFTWVKNQLNQMSQICRAKAEKIEMWQKYYSLNAKQNPPIELLTGQNQTDCAVANEIPPMPAKKENEENAH